MKLYIYITNAGDYLSGNFDNCWYLSDRNNYMIDAWFLAGEVEVDINVDNKVITQFAVDAIDKAGQEEIAEHQVKMDMLKEKKAKLLSITHQ